MVALDRLVPFLARITGWSLAQDGGVDLVLAEEDAAVWDWNPAVDERSTGDSPSVVLPNPSRIATPASIAVGTPVTSSFAALAVSWSPVGSAYLAGYELEYLPASVVVWQGYGAGFGATAAMPTGAASLTRCAARTMSGRAGLFRSSARRAATPRMRKSASTACWQGYALRSSIRSAFSSCQWRS